MKKISVKIIALSLITTMLFSHLNFVFANEPVTTQEASVSETEITETARLKIAEAITAAQQESTKADSRGDAFIKNRYDNISAIDEYFREKYQDSSPAASVESTVISTRRRLHPKTNSFL